MKKFFLMLLCVLFIAGGVSAYTVKGRVIQKNTGTFVSGATVSLTTYDSSGVKIGNNTTSASDGSYSISLSGVSCKGNKMYLKATKGNQSGSLSWYAQQEGETKNIEVVVVFNLNPDLNFIPTPIPFDTVGEVKPVPVKGFIDDTGMAMLIQGFFCTVGFDNNIFHALDVHQVIPRFENFMYDIHQPEGLIYVEAFTSMPVELPNDFFGVDSFFDIIFKLEIPTQGVESSIEILENSIFYLPDGLQITPVPGKALSKLGKATTPATPVFISDFDQWETLLDSPLTDLNIRPMFEVEWAEYITQWRQGLVEGESYPDTTFLPAKLYAYEDEGNFEGQPSPDGDGLIMAWGEGQTLPEGDYASAWVFDYGNDPDLTNCTIQVTVLPPSSANITAVSFAMVDVNNNRESWWWSVPGQIPYDVATTVTINTANPGFAAATPAPAGHMITPGFDITMVQNFDVDENAQWVFGTQPVPPFGMQISGRLWNYWQNLIVRKNEQTAGYKGSYVKYSQPIVEIDKPDQGITLINGWDEVSILDDLSNNNLPLPPHYYLPPRIMADDWKCVDDRPVTDIHWWGSFLGWTQPRPPKIVPKKFHIGIWTDVPANADIPFSHPGKLIWENHCDSWVWNFAGYDVDPRPEPMVNETCFQFNQLLSENEWFYQKPMEYDEAGNIIPNIYWLSIVPIYAPEDIPRIKYPWGWKTRPHMFMDDAVRIMYTDGAFPGGLPKIGDHWKGGEHVFLLDENNREVSWDLAFELTTNIPPEYKSADLNFDGIVNLDDLVIFAGQWLTPGM